MATLTANHCHAIRTFDVERTVIDSVGDASLYRERYALRSDGKLLSQIVWTEDQDGALRWYCRCSKGKCGNCVEGKTARLVHSSGYAIKGAIKGYDRDNSREAADRVRAFLLGRGYTIVSEK